MQVFIDVIGLAGISIENDWDNIVLGFDIEQFPDITLPVTGMQKA